MDDAVLFACGGAACRIIASTGFDRIPTYRINPREAATGNPDFRTPMSRGEEYAIKNTLAGVRVAFVYAMLGGESGSAMLPHVVECARQSGCRVIAVAGLPHPLERERRERAIETLDSIRGIADRIFLMDMGMFEKINGGVKIDSSLRVIGHTISLSMDNLAAIVDGPFFSTFPEPAYTFSYVNDIDPAEAVQRALGATVFHTDPAYGKLIVTVSSGFGTAQIEQIFHTVVSNTGIIPDIVKRDDREDTKVLVFLPVRLTSPRASRSG